MGHHQDTSEGLWNFSQIEKAAKGSHMPWQPPKVKATQPAVMAHSQQAKAQQLPLGLGLAPPPMAGF